MDLLESVQSFVRDAGKRIGLSEARLARIFKADQAYEFTITLKNGKSFAAFRVQHNNHLGPYKGGVRFHPSVTLSDIKGLALLMTLKTAAVGLPLGGAKGGVAVDPRTLSDPELEELSRSYVAHIVSEIGPDRDIMAPDVNTNARIIDWMADEYELLTGKPGNTVVTGKSLAHGGSEGREGATGYGGVMVLDDWLQRTGEGHNELTVAIQGFGNVGSFFGTVGQHLQPQWKVVAAGDSTGGVISRGGLNPDVLQTHKAEGRSFADYPAVGCQRISNDELLGLDVDILALAALDGVINRDNMRSVKARVIVELANGPVDKTAFGHLSAKGTVIIPDIIANAGGVVVSYLEWLQNRDGQHWERERVDRELERYMYEAMRDVAAAAQSNGASLKAAAYELALERLK